VHCLKLADVGGAPLLLAKRAKRTRARAHTHTHTHTRAHKVCARQQNACCPIGCRVTASLPAQMATLPLPCRIKGIIGTCRSVVCYHQWHRREYPFAPFSWFILPLRLPFVTALARHQFFFCLRGAELASGVHTHSLTHTSMSHPLHPCTRYVLSAVWVVHHRVPQGRRH
jgi:hypothetical protein